jgi:hypothetical protein
MVARLATRAVKLFFGLSTCGVSVWIMGSISAGQAGRYREIAVNAPARNRL